MKKIYIIASGLLLILATACVKDKSTSGDHPLPAVVVTGLPDTVSVYTHRDTLRIQPTVTNEGNYNYYWTAFSANFVQGTGHPPIPDTLGRTKDLSCVMLLNPGLYTLVLNVEDKKTGVTQLITSVMNVSTLNMNGWYLLKDDGTKTDFDFIYPTGRIDNWISFYNNGQSLNGTAVKAIFTPSCRTSLTSTDLFNTLTVLSSKDAGMYRIDNGIQVYNFDNMFFETPTTRNVQNALQSQASTNIQLVNDGVSYSMTKGALFTTLPNTYQVSPIAASAAMDIGFDELTKSVFCFNGNTYSPLGTNGATLQHMNAELIWMNGYAGTRSVAMLLFRLADGRGMITKLNGQYGYLAGYTSPLIMVNDTIPATSPIMSASVIAGNYDADYIYYAQGNNIYLTDINSNQQTLQVSLPAGENVTCIQHVKYPQPASATIPATTDFLAIASYANGQYKVYLHKISATGTIQPLAQPNFTGTGRVANVTYMEQGNGSRTF